MNHQISQSTSIIDPFKPIPRELCVKEIANQLYDFGISPIKIGQLREPQSHKIYRYFVGHLFVVITLKSMMLAYVYSNRSEEEIKANERIFIYLGDPFYSFPQIRIHWNAACSFSALYCLLTQILHSILSNNVCKNYAWMLLPLMLQGDVKPAMLGLFQEEDINKLLKR